MEAAMANGIFGVATSLLNNNLAEKREKEARQENYFYGELAAQHADERTRALYNDLQSPSALMQQFREAGLSPSIMAGGNSPGTVGQGAQGGGAAGISPHVFGITPIDFAQINLMNAQAEKAKAEADTTNTMRDAQLENLIANTDNIRLKSANQNLQNAMQTIQNEIAERTKDNQVEISTYELLKMDREFLIKEQELKQEVVKSKISQETADSYIAQEKQKVLNLQFQAILMTAQTELAKSNIQLNKEQINALAQRLSQQDELVSIGWRGIDIKESALNAQIEQWEIENDLSTKGIIAKTLVGTLNAIAKFASK